MFSELLLKFLIKIIIVISVIDCMVLASHMECGESPTIKYRDLAKSLGKLLELIEK